MILVVGLGIFIDISATHMITTRTVTSSVATPSATTQIITQTAVYTTEITTTRVLTITTADSPITTTQTIEITQTLTTTLLVTTTQKTTSVISVIVVPQGSAYVTFQQIGACTPQFWGIPWSVTIANLTLVQPPNTPLPISNYGLYGTTNQSYTKITFLLPNGLYSYAISPNAGFFTPTYGQLVVNGTNSTVPIRYTGTSCTSVTTTATH
jgi:hypothetical protein